MVKPIGDTVETLWAAVIRTSGLIHTNNHRIKAHVIGDVQIEITISIVVKKYGGAAPVGIVDSRRAGNIGKSSVGVIVVEAIESVICDVNIQLPVIINISDRYSHSITFAGQSRGFGDILKRAILSLMVQMIFFRRFVLILVMLPAIDQINIQTTVIVIVKKRAS